MALVSYTDLDPIVYAAAFTAQHTRYQYTNEAGEVLIDFMIKMESKNDWRAIDHGKKTVVKAYNRQGCIEAVKLMFPQPFTEYKYLHVDPVENALQATKTMLDAINKGSGATQYVGCLSIGRCFRHNIATIREYKGNRKSIPKPEYYHQVRDYLLEHKAATPVEFYEADDYMSMAQWADVENVVVSSIDKDMLNFPGRKYVHKKDLKPEDRQIYITFEMGIRNFYAQLLSGDTSDNIPGLKGVKGKPGWGEKTSKKALDKCKTLRECHDFVCAEYHKKYGEKHTYTHWKFDRRVELLAIEEEKRTREEAEELAGLLEDPDSNLTITRNSEEMMNENGQLLWMIRRHTDPLWTCEFMLKEVLNEQTATDLPWEENI